MNLKGRPDRGWSLITKQESAGDAVDGVNPE